MTIATSDIPAAAVRQDVLLRLSSAITTGVFKPGQRLIERELCERFDVSRTSIREALRQLEAEQLIEMIPNRGPMVRRLTEEELQELWEIRTAVECIAARRFALRGTEESIVELEASIDDLGQALRARDVMKIRQRKNAFFECFGRGGGNEVMPRILRQLNARLSFLWSSSLRVPGRADESINELMKLVEAIRARKPDVAHAAIVLYNDHAFEVALAGLRTFEASRDA